jgi:sporulation protein YlmC with PRC-barrel domain
LIILVHDEGILFARRRKTLSKTTMTAMLAAMLALSLPAVAAETTATTTATPSARVTATQMQPGQLRLTDMNGANVYDTQNQKVGDIKDIILDRDGRIAAVVLDVGAFLGMGGKYVAVAMHDLRITFDSNNKPRFAVDMTKDQLKAAQAFDLNPKNATTGTSTPPANRPVATPPTIPPAAPRQ